VVENEQIKIGDHRVLLSHFPYYPNWWDRNIRKVDTRYLHKRIVNRGKVLCCGHVHSEKKIIGKKMIHVGIDCWSRPVSEKEILEIIKEQGWK
jgi:calcineurin-like phosphoesterase family protein